MNIRLIYFFPFNALECLSKMKQIIGNIQFVLPKYFYHSFNINTIQVARKRMKETRLTKFSFDIEY